MKNEIPIERRILSFIDQIISRENIDIIVCGERKGTAVLRALIQEISEPRLNWNWEKIVSTSSIEEFDWEQLSGKKVLLFEELVHHGSALKSKKDELEAFVSQKSHNVDIKTAGFAVWQKCEAPPDFAYYRSLDIKKYEETRADIIRMLQKYGSLLLDTEHIELSVKINCGINEFYHALATASNDGNTFSFLAGTNRLNLTIQNPDIIDREQLNKWLIPGSNFDDVVCKCRIIERDFSSFAVMPIFYPNTRCVADKNWIENLPSFMDKKIVVNAKPKQLFYLVGLLSSIELIKSIVAAMSNLIRNGKIILEVPEDNFPHLSTIFPNIDIDELRTYVFNIVAQSKLIKPLRTLRSVKVNNIEPEKLIKMSYYLITKLLKSIDNEDEEDNADSPKGKSWKQLFNIAKEGMDTIDSELVEWTAVPDRLIDSGIMVTKVHEIESPEGEKLVIRTFVPDGETVSKRLRRQLAVKGEKWLPTI